MADPQIQKLLIVQDRDITVTKIELELKRIPEERATLMRHIEQETANIEAARHNLKAKEVQRNELDMTVKSKESEIARFSHQQLQVKKNDEYRALTQQIEQAKADISDLEEQEIGLMLEIDDLTEVFNADKATIEQRIAEYRRQIDLLKDKEANLKVSIDTARADLAASREGVEENYMDHYDRVRKLVKRAPFVARIQSQVCGGCHLRVSNEIAREALNAGEPHFCDQCARIVYV